MAVCDHGNFTRAAQFTYVSQPSLTQAIKKLESGLLDLVISAPTQLLGQPYQSTLLYEERYVVAFSPAHRFNQLTKIDLKDIQSEPYLDRLNCEMREKLKSICQDREINLYASYRSNSEEWIVNMVRAGLDVALIPEYTLPKDADDVNYRYLSDPAISRQIYAIYAPQLLKKNELKTLIAGLNCGL